MMQGLGLVFVAVYQKALKLMYVDELLERVKAEFALLYKPDTRTKYSSFDQTFRQMLKQAENQAEAMAKRPLANGVAIRAAGNGVLKVRSTCASAACSAGMLQ
jgi:hypothetical protein